MKHLRMSHILILVSLIALLVIGCVTKAEARPTLARDPNGTAIQFSRSFTCYSDSVAASVAVDSVAVATNSVEATIIARHNAVWVRHQVTTTAADANYIYIPVGVPVTIPVMGNSYICWKNACTTSGGGRISIIWQKM